MRCERLGLLAPASLLSCTLVLHAYADQPEPRASSAAQPTAAPQATASTADPKEDAMLRFRRAIELYSEHDYRAALIEFQQAYKLAPSYKILFNLGQCCYQLQDYVCALKSFERYLSEGASEVPPERQELVQGDIARLQPRVGRLEVLTNVMEVQISIDDVPSGSTPLEAPIIVNTGRRKVTVSKEGRLPITRMVDVPGATVTKVEFSLQTLQGKDRTIIVEKDTPSKMTTLSWVGIGGAAALAGASTFFALSANSAAKDLEDMRFAGATPTSEIDDQQSKANTRALMADVFGGAAILTLGTTLVLTFTRPDPEPSPAREAPPAPPVAVRFGPRGVSFDGRF